MRARQWTGLGAAGAAAALATWLANACLPLAPAEDVPGDASSEVVEPSDTGETILVTGLKVTPDPNNVLIATLTYTTNIPALGTVKVTNTTDKSGINVVTPPADTTLATSHSVTLLGLGASSDSPSSWTSRTRRATRAPTRRPTPPPPSRRACRP